MPVIDDIAVSADANRLAAFADCFADYCNDVAVAFCIGARMEVPSGAKAESLACLAMPRYLSGAPFDEELMELYQSCSCASCLLSTGFWSMFLAELVSLVKLGQLEGCGSLLIQSLSGEVALRLSEYLVAFPGSASVQFAKQMAQVVASSLPDVARIMRRLEVQEAHEMFDAYLHNLTDHWCNRVGG